MAPFQTGAGQTVRANHHGWVSAGGFLLAQGAQIEVVLQELAQQ
ncbi:hypothetical protein [Streptomyces sp. NPDC002156]